MSPRLLLVFGVLSPSDCEVTDWGVHGVFGLLGKGEPNVEDITLSSSSNSSSSAF